jgi:hypothetical protein
MHTNLRNGIRTFALDEIAFCLLGAHSLPCFALTCFASLRVLLCLILQELSIQKRTRGGGIEQELGGDWLIIAARSPPICRLAVCSMLMPNTDACMPHFAGAAHLGAHPRWWHRTVAGGHLANYSSLKAPNLSFDSLFDADALH